MPRGAVWVVLVAVAHGGVQHLGTAWAGSSGGGWWQRHGTTGRAGKVAQQHGTAGQPEWAGKGAASICHKHVVTL